MASFVGVVSVAEVINQLSRGVEAGSGCYVRQSLVKVAFGALAMCILSPALLYAAAVVGTCRQLLAVLVLGLPRQRAFKRSSFRWCTATNANLLKLKGNKGSI